MYDKELDDAVSQLIREHKAGCGDAIRNFVEFYKDWIDRKISDEQD